MVDFMKYKWLYFLISSAVIVPGLISLFLFGLRPAIDFTGGTTWEITFEKSIAVAKSQRPEEVLKAFFTNQKLQDVSVSHGAGNTYTLRAKEISQTEKEIIAKNLTDQFGKFIEGRFESIGPTLGSELLTKTLFGVVLATILILLYIAYRFGEKSFGVCATIATFHDSLVILGIFSLLGHFLGVEVDTLFVTAVLTVLSFSVHDTVVVYDRIRELRNKNFKEDFTTNVNLAVNQTLVRSLNNSLTVILMLLALVLLGGETTKWFAIALLIGMITGTYSSVFVAAPLLSLWHEKAKTGFKKKV